MLILPTKIKQKWLCGYGTIFITFRGKKSSSYVSAKLLESDKSKEKVGTEQLFFDSTTFRVVTKNGRIAKKFKIYSEFDITELGPML